MNGMSVRYSEAFKRQVVEQMDRGKYPSAEEARRAYEIRGSTTAGKGIKTYGRAESQVKRTRIETVKEMESDPWKSGRDTRSVPHLPASVPPFVAVPSHSCSTLPSGTSSPCLVGDVSIEAAGGRHFHEVATRPALMADPQIKINERKENEL